MSSFNQQEVGLPESTTPALKEWAVVCKALERGRQTILLRKGGIMEYRRGFEVKHNDFFLYPTFEHQSKEYLQQDYLSELDIVLQDRPKDNKNKITTFANAVEVKETNDGEILRRLGKFHIWNEHYVNIRLNYNPKKPMSVIILRVHRMIPPLQIEIEPEFAGCKSWIPIHLSPSDKESTSAQEKIQNSPVLLRSLIGHSQPVFSDSEFRNIIAKIREVFN